MSRDRSSNRPIASETLKNKVFMARIRWFCVVLPVAVLLLALPGRAFPLEKGKASRYSLSVELKPFYPSELRRYGLKTAHPYRFDLETLDRYMRQLAYQKKRLSWTTEKRMFPKALLHTMVERIAKRFSEAGPDQRVVFQIDDASGKTMLLGDTFLTKTGLHWRTTVLLGKRRDIEDFSVAGETWRLVPRKNLDYFRARRFEDLEQNLTNWLVFTKVRPEPARQADSVSVPAPEPAAPAAPNSVEQRLKTLEGLKKEGLVSDQEYRRLRESILSGL